MSFLKWWPWLLGFLIVFILEYWPGSLGPFIGRPYNQYTPLIWGWIPGWFFYQLVVYYLGGIYLTIFSFKVLLPLFKELNDKKESVK